jgi:hypothetical protein
LFLRHKLKKELAGPTPVKALRSGAAVIMRTAADDAAWVMRLQATMERLKQREAAAQARAGAQEVTGPDPATQGLGSTETVVPSGARLEAPGTGGLEPGSTATTQASIKATEAETSVCDVGRADVGEEQEVVEAPSEARQEAAQPEEP